MNQRLTMVIDDTRKRKLVHIIPFDDDPGAVLASATKRAKTQTATVSPLLSSLEQDGLQALLTLGAPVQYVSRQIRSSRHHAIRPDEKSTKTLTDGSNLAAPSKALDSTQSGQTVSSSNVSLQKGILGKPLLPPPAPHYLGRPLALPPPLPRIPYGCIFSKKNSCKPNECGRETVTSQKYGD
jgi:hypothetical protein